MDWSRFFLNPAVVWVLIPVTAILVGGIQQLVKMFLTHQERIAMIEQGIHPDEALSPEAMENKGEQWS